MRIAITLVALVVMVSACVGGKRVEGNAVNYTSTERITVDSSFAYLGSALFSYDEKLVNHLKSSYGTGRSEIFVKKFGETNEAVEILSVSWSMPSDNVAFASWLRGEKPDRLYRLRVADVRKEYLNLFDSAGVVASNDLQCFQVKTVVESRSERYIDYCVAVTVLPQGVSLQPYMQDKLSNVVKFSTVE